MKYANTFFCFSMCIPSMRFRKRLTSPLVALRLAACVSGRRAAEQARRRDGARLRVYEVGLARGRSHTHVSSRQHVHHHTKTWRPA